MAEKTLEDWNNLSEKEKEKIAEEEYLADIEYQQWKFEQKLLNGILEIPPYILRSGDK